MPVHPDFRGFPHSRELSEMNTNEQSLCAELDKIDFNLVFCMTIGLN